MRLPFKGFAGLKWGTYLYMKEKLKRPHLSIYNQSYELHYARLKVRKHPDQLILQYLLLCLVDNNHQCKQSSQLVTPETYASGTPSVHACNNTLLGVGPCKSVDVRNAVNSKQYCRCDIKT